MSEIKLLIKNGLKNGSMMDTVFPDFINSLKDLYDSDIEIVEKADTNFKGIYIIPYSTGLNIKDYKKDLNSNLFIIGVPNYQKDSVFDEFKPIGLMQWRFFKDKSTSIYAQNEILKFHKIPLTGIKGGDCYTNFIPLEKDDTTKTVAKSVLTYFEMYYEYIENIN
ncbi:hypothetical protein [uncultured Kordia sp.]|uniref:hypothetical protein n=1 Tax=uncultured Kordia sp. TaxID=507699 RepID=UPI00262C0985|nr:hypothetical protein [uncultured Kordia sp.]